MTVQGEQGLSLLDKPRDRDATNMYIQRNVFVSLSVQCRAVERGGVAAAQIVRQIAHDALFARPAADLGAQRLVAAGRPLRVLIAYGEYWFPWYMRRLAERPANIAFFLRALATRS